MLRGGKVRRLSLLPVNSDKHACENEARANACGRLIILKSDIEIQPTPRNLSKIP